MAKVIALLLSAYLTSGNDLQELLSVDDCEGLDTCDLSLRQLRGNLTSQAFEILGIDSTWGYCEDSGHPIPKSKQPINPGIFWIDFFQCKKQRFPKDGSFFR